uniref:Uncharacterized protein n=1 Tax=Anopheles albimanus TaxID=7167 RepID=A0A182FXE3_ANOAL
MIRLIETDFHRRFNN